MLDPKTWCLQWWHCSVRLKLYEKATQRFYSFESGCPWHSFLASMLQAMLACAARQRQPDPVAFASFMNWILVRNCITVLHRSMPTIDVFQEMLGDCSFTSEQHKFTKALKTIYTKGCRKIYSPFAYEDCAVQVFHSNLRHCSECNDPFAFWFLLLAFAAGTNRQMMFFVSRVRSSMFIYCWGRYVVSLCVYLYECDICIFLL